MFLMLSPSLVFWLKQGGLRPFEINVKELRSVRSALLSVKSVKRAYRAFRSVNDDEATIHSKALS